MNLRKSLFSLPIHGDLRFSAKGDSVHSTSREVGPHPPAVTMIMERYKLRPVGDMKDPIAALRSDPQDRIRPMNRS